MRLVVERHGVGGWLPVGVVRPGEQPGSVSDLMSGGRQMLLFLCDEVGAMVSRSPVIAHEALVPGSDVVLCAPGLKILAMLREPGDYYEKWVRMDSGFDTLVRWTWRP